MATVNDGGGSPLYAPYAKPRTPVDLSGADPAIAAKMREAQSRNARTYALARLRQLAAAGFDTPMGGANPDNPTTLSQAASAGLTSGDPAAVWRALSAQFMQLHQAAAPQGAEADPRVWLANRTAAQRQALARTQIARRPGGTTGGV